MSEEEVLLFWAGVEKENDQLLIPGSMGQDRG